MAKDYKDIARKALRMAADKTILNEGFGYPEGMMERIHPILLIGKPLLVTTQRYLKVV